MEQSVPKRRHIKFRRQGISQKKAYNKVNSLFNLPCFHLFRRQETHFSKHLYTQTIIRCMSTLILNPRSLWSPPPYGATVRGGLWPLLQYASRSLGSLLYLCLRLYPSFSGPWTRHPAISFLVFLFVLLHTAFRTAPFLGLRCFAFFSIWPSHRILWPLINLTMFSPLIMFSNSSFCRVFHNSFSFTRPYIFRKIFLSNTANALSSSMVSVHNSEP